MSSAMRFGDVLDAADQLPADEQEELIAILQRRRAEAARKQLAADIREAREQFSQGQCLPVTPDELMREILK